MKKTFSKLLIFIWIATMVAILLSGCVISRQSAIRRINRYEANYPDLIKEKIKFITTYSNDSFDLKIPVSVDSAAIDSLMNIYCHDLELKTDTVHHHDTITSIKTIQQYIYRQASPINIIRPSSYLLTSGSDTIIVGVKGSLSGLELKILEHKKNVEEIKTDTTPPSTPSTWQEIKAGYALWILFFVGGLIIGVTLTYKIIKKVNSKT